MHTSGGPAGSPASFYPVSLVSYFTGIFERLVLNRLCFNLDSKNLVSLVRAGFKPNGSTVDQVLLLSQTVW